MTLQEAVELFQACPYRFDPIDLSKCTGCPLLYRYDGDYLCLTLDVIVSTLEVL